MFKSKKIIVFALVFLMVLIFIPTAKAEAINLANIQASIDDAQRKMIEILQKQIADLLEKLGKTATSTIEKGGKTCEEKCKEMNYLSGYCNTWTKDSEQSKKNCKTDEKNVGYTSDCKFTKGKPAYQGAGKNCCCTGKIAECAKDGENVFSKKGYGPTKCCRGLAVKPSIIYDGAKCNDTARKEKFIKGTCSSTWSTTCGDGTCGTGEDICNCAKDCATCEQGCAARSYSYSYCNSWAISPEGLKNSGCLPKEYKLSWTSDCKVDTNTVGVGKTCCCAKTTCAKEGEIIYFFPAADGKPTSCCKGLKAIRNCTAQGTCTNDGSSICAYCGNGTCGTGENSYNCSKDCGKPNCAKEGKGILSNDQAKQCCSGLTKVSTSIIDNATCTPVTVSSVYSDICIKCGNGICGTGENKCNCPADCGAITCYKEGEGEIGITTGSAIACCAGLTAKPRTTCTGTTCLNTEGFICQK